MTAGLAGNPFATVSASAAAGPQSSSGTAADDPAAAPLPRPVSAGVRALLVAQSNLLHLRGLSQKASEGKR